MCMERERAIFVAEYCFKYRKQQNPKCAVRLFEMSFVGRRHRIFVFSPVKRAIIEVKQWARCYFADNAADHQKTYLVWFFYGGFLDYPTMRSDRNGPEWVLLTKVAIRIFFEGVLNFILSRHDRGLTPLCRWAVYTSDIAAVAGLRCSDVVSAFAAVVAST